MRRQAVLAIWGMGQVVAACGRSEHAPVETPTVHWSVTELMPSGDRPLIAMAESVAHPGDNIVSTTALDRTLEAGKRYELLAYWDGAANVDYDSVKSLPFASFGTVSSMLELSQQIFAMRVATTLP